MELLADVTARQSEHQRSRDFVRWLSCLHVCRGSRSAATDLFVERWPRSFSRDIVTKTVGACITSHVALATTEMAWLTKAVVVPGGTTDPAWAGVLTTDRLAAAFLDEARRASVLGKIPGLQRIPFHVKVPTLTQDADYVWVGEGQLKPVSRFTFEGGVTLGATKALGDVVVTDELARLAVPELEGFLHRKLVNGVTKFTDRQFLDPAVAVVPDVHPPSITHGVAPTAGAGDLAKDLATLLAALRASRPDVESPVLITAPGVIPSTMVPVGVSVVTSPAAADLVVAIDPAAVFVADAGIAFDISGEAMVQMSDAPIGTAAAVWTSLWQTNLAAYKVERFVNWEPLTGAVQYLTLA